MVQAKTSDFQPLPLKILNVLSLLAGASLLVAVSWEILLGDPRHYSTDYLLLQGIVCVVFLADFFARMWMADHSWRFFFRNLYFFLLSVPYLNIVDWMGIELSHAEAMLMAPLLRKAISSKILISKRNRDFLFSDGTQKTAEYYRSRCSNRWSKKGGARISTEQDCFSLICNILRVEKACMVSYFCPTKKL